MPVERRRPAPRAEAAADRAAPDAVARRAHDRAADRRSPPPPRARAPPTGEPMDYTRIPRELDKKFEALDDRRRAAADDHQPRRCVEPHRPEGAAGAAKTATDDDGRSRRTEKHRAFDLLDALTKSGALPIDDASLHVVLAATHCFDKTLLDTVIQDNVNPIEKVERSLMIVGTTVHGRPRQRAAGRRPARAVLHHLAAARPARGLLGILWILIQSLSLIFIYTFVFFVLNKASNLPSSNLDYSSYIFSGLLFWIPLQEMLIRGVSILTENRQLIKRSTLGVDLFLWIPFIQMLIHSFVISIPVFVVLAWVGSLNYQLFYLSYFMMIAVGLYLMLVLSYLARINILLKDISPIIRLFSQFLFWTLPVLYFPTGILKEVNQYNPLIVPIDLFRFIVLKDYSLQFPFFIFLIPLVFFIIIFCLTRFKLDEVVMDHL
jgi:lipopolysaccharide transport system permease protein